MNVGIIGCGKIGEKRAKILGSNLIGCYDINSESSLNFAKKFNCKHYINEDDLINNSDIIIISTSNDAIYGVAMKAIYKNKHLLIEKPAGISSKQILELYEESKKYGSIVRVGFNHRYHPAIALAKNFIDAKMIGEIMFIRANYGHGGRLGYDKEWRSKKSFGGGELLDQGVHLIDLSRWMLGKKSFQKLAGSAKTYFWDMEVEDNGFMLLEDEDGRTAFLNVSCTEWRNEFSFDIYGKEGRLSIRGLGGSYGTEKLTLYKMSPEMGMPKITSWEYPEEDDSWTKEWNHFVSDISYSIVPSANLADAYHAIKVVEKIRGYTND